MHKVSIIMAAYQAEASIETAIHSVMNTWRRNEIELVIVDDASLDKTSERVRELQNYYPNIKFFQLPANNGGPSYPRNVGIKNATGTYITFLDDDDQCDPDRLLRMIDLILADKIDVAKGYMRIFNGQTYRFANQIPTIPVGLRKTIEAMIQLQSLTSDTIIRREFAQKNSLAFCPDLKIGEDTVFFTGSFVLATSVQYIDDYWLTQNKLPANWESLSSTQRWGDREVKDQLTAWSMAQNQTQNLGIDFYKLRLGAGMRNLLLSLVRFGTGLSEETFTSLSIFTNQTQQYVHGKLQLAARYQELYEAICGGNYSVFQSIVRKRLLIAGYDLKFILPLIPYLKNEYSILVDEWTGHDSHISAKSKECLKWADIIWCEWMLGNAVFYSKHKSKYQVLLIRAHRFELFRDFGHQIDFKNVEIVFAVGYHYLKLFQDKFDIPSDKIRLLSNYIDSETFHSFRHQFKSSYVKQPFTIGMVGILPSRKGFHRSLEILKNLHNRDCNVILRIVGALPSEVAWIEGNPEEKKYFENCMIYIKENGLENYVIFDGQVPRNEIYKSIDIVLSLSDAEQPESFHLTPAESAMAGSMGLLIYWPGVEYLYPKKFICKNEEELIERIQKYMEEPLRLTRDAEQMRCFIEEQYDIKIFLATMHRYLFQANLME